MDKTNWFPGHIKPFHVGYYERQYRRAIEDWWDGKVWRYTGVSEEIPCVMQNLKWRGLTEKAE